MEKQTTLITHVTSFGMPIKYTPAISEYYKGKRVNNIPYMVCIFKYRSLDVLQKIYLKFKNDENKWRNSTAVPSLNIISPPYNKKFYHNENFDITDYDEYKKNPVVISTTPNNNKNNFIEVNDNNNNKKKKQNLKDSPGVSNTRYEGSPLVSNIKNHDKDPIFNTIKDETSSYINNTKNDDGLVNQTYINNTNIMNNNNNNNNNNPYYHPTTVYNVMISDTDEYKTKNKNEPLKDVTNLDTTTKQKKMNIINKLIGFNKASSSSDEEVGKKLNNKKEKKIYDEGGNGFDEEDDKENNNQKKKKKGLKTPPTKNENDKCMIISENPKKKKSNKCLCVDESIINAMNFNYFEEGEKEVAVGEDEGERGEEEEKQKKKKNNKCLCVDESTINAMNFNYFEEGEKKKETDKEKGSQKKKSDDKEKKQDDEKQNRKKNIKCPCVNNESMIKPTKMATTVEEASSSSLPPSKQNKCCIADSEEGKERERAVLMKPTKSLSSHNKCCTMDPNERKDKKEISAPNQSHSKCCYSSISNTKEKDKSIKKQQRNSHSKCCTASEEKDDYHKKSGSTSNDSKHHGNHHHHHRHEENSTRSKQKMKRKSSLSKCTEKDPDEVAREREREINYVLNPQEPVQQVLQSPNTTTTTTNNNNNNKRSNRVSSNRNVHFDIQSSMENNEPNPFDYYDSNRDEIHNILNLIQQYEEEMQRGFQEIKNRCEKVHHNIYMERMKNQNNNITNLTSNSSCDASSSLQNNDNYVTINSKDYTFPPPLLPTSTNSNNNIVDNNNYYSAMNPILLNNILNYIKHMNPTIDQNNNKDTNNNEHALKDKKDHDIDKNNNNFTSDHKSNNDSKLNVSPIKNKDSSNTIVTNDINGNPINSENPKVNSNPIVTPMNDANLPGNANNKQEKSSIYDLSFFQQYFSRENHGNEASNSIKNNTTSNANIPNTTTDSIVPEKVNTTSPALNNTSLEKNNQTTIIMNSNNSIPVNDKTMKSNTSINQSFLNTSTKDKNKSIMINQDNKSKSIIDNTSPVNSVDNKKYHLATSNDIIHKSDTSKPRSNPNLLLNNGNSLESIQSNKKNIDKESGVINDYKDNNNINNSLNTINNNEKVRDVANSIVLNSSSNHGIQDRPTNLNKKDNISGILNSYTKNSEEKSHNTSTSNKDEKSYDNNSITKNILSALNLKKAFGHDNEPKKLGNVKNKLNMKELLSLEENVMKSYINNFPPVVMNEEDGKEEISITVTTNNDKITEIASKSEPATPKSKLDDATSKITIPMAPSATSLPDTKPFILPTDTSDKPQSIMNIKKIISTDIKPISIINNDFPSISNNETLTPPPKEAQKLNEMDRQTTTLFNSMDVKSTKFTEPKSTIPKVSPVETKLIMPSSSNKIKSTLSVVPSTETNNATVAPVETKSINLVTPSSTETKSTLLVTPLPTETKSSNTIETPLPTETKSSNTIGTPVKIEYTHPETKPRITNSSSSISFPVEVKEIDQGTSMLASSTEIVENKTPKRVNSLADTVEIPSTPSEELSLAETIPTSVTNIPTTKSVSNSKKNKKNKKNKKK
ncbi:hypothetical protein BCR36DRAFT_87518 [Piromyces finnis]|uniref:Uncharacterized protein n=1 Tax=Piromyces finnis TaxID=1754191 RepID=A0A1Y1VLP9_9FUNG|nr:hypothetical protein BCR36DRAFT_87518 [Piromyces finnis]|eukprot:ORX59075.1 hypothetical protein BCR36DRAFT_87518 [Piromyces finnis]